MYYNLTAYTITDVTTESSEKYKTITIDLKLSPDENSEDTSKRKYKNVTMTAQTDCCEGGYFTGVDKWRNLCGKRIKDITGKCPITIICVDGSCYEFSVHGRSSLCEGMDWTMSCN